MQIIISVSSITYMLKTTNLASPRNKTESLLSQRQILNALELCPQIMKQDKLYIRNKVKQVFRDIQINNVTGLIEYGDNSEIMELLHIFSDCRKPLNRVHLYQNHQRWLQVKLRKYINLQRRKDKQQCLNQYKRDKMMEKKKKMMQRRIKGDDVEIKDGYSMHTSQRKGNYSQQNKRPHSPRQQMPFQRANQTDRHRGKHLSGNISPTYEVSYNHNFGPQTCKNAQNRLNSNWNENADFNLLNRIRSNQKNRNNNIDQLKINQPKRRAQNSSEAGKKPSKQKADVFRQYIDNQGNADGSVIYNQDNPTDQFPYIVDYDKQKDNFNVYQHQHNIKNSDKLVSKFSDRNQNLYTSPELLEECRRFLQKSTAATNIQSSYKAKEAPRKQYLQSMDVFEKIECPQYHQYNSPQFNQPFGVSKPIPVQPTIQKFKDLKQMLKYIFERGWAVFLRSSQKQQIIKRCPIGYQQIVSLLMTQIDDKTNYLNFLQILPTLKKQLNLNFSFSNVFLLLDVDSKGIITHSDYELFLQNFTNCSIELHVLQQLKQSLFKLEQALEKVFKGNDIVPGCIEYLQLMDKPQIYQLGEILQLFEFEIDSGTSNELHDSYQ